MLTFVRSMMEWLGGTVSKEDVGEEGNNNRRDSKRKRDDDGEEEALGALALRFKYVMIFYVVEDFSSHYQTSRNISNSRGVARTIFIQRSKADTCCASIAVSWAFAKAVLRICHSTRQRCLAH